MIVLLIPRSIPVPLLFWLECWYALSIGLAQQSGHITIENTNNGCGVCLVEGSHNPEERVIVTVIRDIVKQLRTQW